MQKEIMVNLSEFMSRWPSPYVAREEIGRFSGGILTSKYMANLDCEGKGPKNTIRIGRKIAYHVPSLIEWLEQRSSKVK